MLDVVPLLRRQESGVSRHSGRRRGYSRRVARRPRVAGTDDSHVRARQGANQVFRRPGRGPRGGSLMIDVERNEAALRHALRALGHRPRVAVFRYCNVCADPTRGPCVAVTCDACLLSYEWHVREHVSTAYGCPGEDGTCRHSRIGERLYHECTHCGNDPESCYIGQEVFFDGGGGDD